MSKNTRGACVLVHGYRWGTPNWEHVMWGDIQRREFGRIVKGIEIALRWDARVYWGGGPDIDDIFSFAHGRKEELVSLFGEGVEDIFTSRSVMGKNGGRTITEVQEALELCQMERLSSLILVSDEVHIERCILLALRARKMLELRDRVDIIPVPSDTTYTDQMPVFFEPRTAYRDNLHDVAFELLELDGMLNGNVTHVRERLHSLIHTLKKLHTKR